MTKKLSPNLEHLFFYLKFNPLPVEKIRYNRGRKIIFSNDDYARMAENHLKWADELIPLMIQQSYRTMLQIKDKIKKDEKETRLNVW